MKNFLIKLFILSLLILSFHSCTQKNIRKEQANYVSADTSWKSMTLREKIGQTMIINCRIFHQGNLDTFLTKYPVGGFFLPDWYFKYYVPYDSIPFYIRQSIIKYQESSKTPLIFMEDFERGVGALYTQYTQMPVGMSLGAARSEELAYNFEKSIALQAKSLGFNWLLHPVADLNMNPLHALVNERSVSDDPDIAVPLLINQLNAIQGQGLVATIKHFPGDGVTMRDQHLITASNTLSKKQWKKTFGRVFQALIDEGAGAVMVGHITLPAFQNEKINGHYLPATLSHELIDYLKNDMNFKGVVVSDALNMGGFSGYYENELEASIESFKAGMDILLWPSLDFMDTLEARILRNEIPVERLNDAVSRIWAVKDAFGLLAENRTLYKHIALSDAKFIENTADKIAENAITFVQGDDPFIPLDTNHVKKILLVNLSQRDKSEIFKPTKEFFEKRGFVTDLQYGMSYFNWNWRWNELLKYDRIIICIENKYQDPVGTPFFSGLQAESVWSVNNLPREKMIVVSYSNPYYHKFYFEKIPVCINAYSSDIHTQEAVVKCLTGEIPFKGKSPVKLDHEIFK